MSSADHSAAAPAPPEADGEPSYRLEDQVGFLLRKAGQRHTAIFMAHMVEDLTATQWAALAKTAELGTVSQNQLGRETAMDAATIKGVVDRLIRRGLLAVSADPDDSRRNLVSVTGRGREVAVTGIPAALRITDETLNGLTSGERQLLLELLQKIG